MNLSLAINDTSWNSYAPSMKYLWGRALFKLTGKRPLEWWLFNKRTVALINDFKPQLVLVTGIFPLTNEVFNSSKKISAKVVNFLTDDPFVKQLYSSIFITNLKKYDLVISTKKRIIPDLIASGVKQTEFLPYAYDPFWHHLPDTVSEFEKEKFVADISFVGTGALERLPMLEAVASLGNLNLKLYGNDWKNIYVKGWKKSPAVFDNEFRLAIYSSKISLGLLRKRSRDESTQRSFEIASCGGCGIYEDSQEHRQILDGYPEYGFFSSPMDLADKCKWLLEKPTEREQMRQLGIQLVATEENTFSARLKTILNLINLSN
ncbi:CgeB family protein [Aetokthonos hydrillicola]|nr:glycosyltransferase [Aetokthonos hydrillicola]